MSASTQDHSSRFAGLLRRLLSRRGVPAISFALLGILGASEGSPSPRTLRWALVTMAAAWAASALFSRLADRIDGPGAARQSALTRPAWAAAGCATALFGFSAGMLGPLPWLLAPLALGLLLGYRLARRFTHFSPAVLDLALAGAPLGAWIAVAGRPEPPAAWLSLGVLAWTVGAHHSSPPPGQDLATPLAPSPPGRACAQGFPHQALALAAWAVFTLEMQAHLLPWLAWGSVAILLLRRQDRIRHSSVMTDALAGPLLLLGFLLERLHGIICS